MSTMRRLVLAATLLLPFAPLASVAATFAEETPFNQTAFTAAQKTGGPILVHVTASWCSTCAAQKPIIDKLLGEPKYKNLKVFNIDFDSQKPLLHRFGVRMQSTLIVYKGSKEEDRSSGETKPAAIASLVDKAL